MRIYMNFQEALAEIKRDLAEMGIHVHPQTYQDQFVGDNPDFETLELQNYIYVVTRPDGEDLDPTQPWADAEWAERAIGINAKGYINPGAAWELRRDVWEQFLQPNGHFSYTYNERFGLFEQVLRVIDRLKKDPDSRQLFIGMWNASDSTKLGGISRVPCSLGYYVQCRRNALHLTYLQRSADFATHFVNDIYMAYRLQYLIAEATELETGNFTHWIGSLHIFAKDTEEVF